MIVHKFPADPGDTLLGRLQRGTGAGYLEALATDQETARVALKSAIRLDWRWDGQLDSRSWYYACLADDVGISSSDIEKLMLSTGGHDPLDAADAVAVHVLGRFASWGDKPARERLIDYVRYGSSPDIPVQWCDTQGATEDLDRLYLALAARFPNKAAMAKDTARLSDLAFSLESLAKRDDRFLRFTRLIDSVKRSRTLQNTEPTPNTTELFPAGTTFEEGCRLFLSSSREYRLGFGAEIRRRRDLVNWLGEQFSSAQAGWLMDFILADHPDTAIARLPDLATILPAEEWPVFIRRALADGREGPRLAASELLERSEHPDQTFVQCCLRSAIAANDMYPACNMLDVVKRFRMIDLVSEVELAYRDATYSYGGRLRAVETLEALTPSLFCERYARECLWDCEQLIIEIGCRHVDLDALDVRPRLEFLCDAFEDDPDEDSQSIVQAARGRLGY